jgi:hypothetical protein
MHTTTSSIANSRCGAGFSTTYMSIPS